MAQLHGSESEQVVRLISVPVIKVIHVSEDDSFESISKNISRYHGIASHILLDTVIKGSKLQGGTGKAFDWELAAKLQAQSPIILAGGLNSDNVKDAVIKVKPWCVDVCSGIEYPQEKGQKDASKIKAFMANIHAVYSPL
jgi:anthranilate synthase/indole-3-glycerol phosphate synthase/phosphoribosylanthranilate isomerase